jgi:hypothetical protein
MVDPGKACCELLSDVVHKTFNAKANTMLKRYHSMFLARGGKEALRSSLRETRKHEGLGKRKNLSTAKSTPEVMQG